MYASLFVIVCFLIYQFILFIILIQFNISFCIALFIPVTGGYAFRLLCCVPVEKRKINGFVLNMNCVNSCLRCRIVI